MKEENFFKRVIGNVEAWWAKMDEKKRIFIGCIGIAIALGVIGAIFG